MPGPAEPTTDGFRFNAGRLCLDFTNTVRFRPVSDRRDLINDYEDLLGWAAAGPVSSRGAYAGVVEHSVYVAPGARGRGVGGALLRALIGSTEAAGIWTIQSGIFPENTASLHLHEREGFRVVGIRERIGHLNGRWRDVVLVERRSTVAGLAESAPA